MQIAIIGYGKMGKEIEKIAKERGHSISIVIDENNLSEFDSENFRKSDVAIEFTKPNVAINNYVTCFEKGVPVVSGTTGWLGNWGKIVAKCNNQNGTFFYASNFSLGVNILFYMNKRLAQIMNAFENYNVEIDETHHTQKLDAPSGTAIFLANDIIDNLNRKNDWKLDKINTESEIKIKAHRLDKVPGEHTIKYESNVDIIELKHAAKSRQGFVMGAILAAEFVYNKKGVFSMNDLLKF
jgi:4-hydroxy-tetrahydrodipicolinate reductase